MERKITIRDKKEDVFRAYEELLAKYKEKEKLAETAEKEAQARKAAEEELVKKAATFTVEDIVTGLADLKVKMGKALIDLSDKLVAEATRLQELQQAIAIEKRNLEEIYDIQVAAETLSSLIQTHEANKKAFAEERQAMRAEWEKEKKNHEIAVQEQEEQLKKEREREAEEYGYNLALSRKKEKDAYEEKRAALTKSLKEEREKQEKEFTEREAALAAREAEVVELKARVDAFPNELQRAVEKARKEAMTQAEKEAKHKAELVAREFEELKKVADLKIKTLEETVANQAAQIEALNAQLSKATNQVQEIAVKAIEGASGLKALAAVNEIALEQAKKVGTGKT